MTTIEILTIESLAAIGPPLEDTLSTFHFLLGTLFRHDQSLLHAERHSSIASDPDGQTPWYLRPRTLGRIGNAVPFHNHEASTAHQEPSAYQEGPDELIALLPSALVSSCATRLAVILGIPHTDSGQGQFSLEQLPSPHTQPPQPRHCHLFLSNCRATGFWIRIYAQVV